MTQTEDIEIGTLINGPEIGKKHLGKYIRSRCKSCGIEWWGYYSRIKSNPSRLCRTCHQRGYGRVNRIKLPSPEMVDGCVHHWIIESGSGGTSPGNCQKCGEKKDFLNYMDYDFRGEHIDYKNSEPGTGWLSHPGPRRGPLN
jgi:hypothetical protein